MVARDRPEVQLAYVNLQEEDHYYIMKTMENGKCDTRLVSTPAIMARCVSPLAQNTGDTTLIRAIKNQMWEARLASAASI